MSDSSSNDILKNIDLISALHQDKDNHLSRALIAYLNEAYTLIEKHMDDLSQDLQSYSQHFLDAITASKYLLIEMTQDYDEGEI